MRTTREIADGGEYCNTPKSFFSNFSHAWENAACQVWKLETKQEYTERGNPSYDKLEEDDFDAALRLISEAGKGDDQLYRDVARKRLDFVRCRPVAFPLTMYLQWEFACYVNNAKRGERIYCCDRGANEDLFDKLALQDFMVFDCTVAFVHDYDDRGEIKGGWRITHKEDILDLLCIFAQIKSVSRDFRTYTGEHAQEFDEKVVQLITSAG